MRLVKTGKVFGNWLVTGLSTKYFLKGKKMYDGKEGFFLVKDHLVCMFVPFKDVLASHRLEK